MNSLEPYYRKGIQMWLGRKIQLPCAQTCHSPHSSVIEWGRGIDEQTSLAVVINVPLPVFLMGHLIKNLLVAAGLLSYPITAPPCQNLCHWPLHPSPTQTCPSCLIWHLCLEVLWWNATRLLCLRRCSLLAAIHFAAMMVLCAVAEWPVAGSEVGRVSGVKVQGTMVKESEGIDAAAFHHYPLCTLQAGWKSSPLEAYCPASTCL